MAGKSFRLGDVVVPEVPVSDSPNDPVNHPEHYTTHPSGVECIVITEHMNFCLGNAVKYIWRSDKKGSDIEDLEKARWYIDREITRRLAVNDVKGGDSENEAQPSGNGEGL